MPALSGSDVAYKQNRAGIARAGTTRANYYFANHVVTINGTNRSSVVLFDSLRVSLHKNDNPDSAEFVVTRNPGFTPTAGQTVSIGLGESGNPTFSGQVAEVRRQRVLGEPYPFYSVTCIDWSRLFNRRLITYDFSGLSATDIAVAIVNDYTSGFVTSGIKSGLATIEEFFCINETPLGVLKRLATILNGGCNIDARMIVHLWDSAGPTGAYTPTNPTTLTQSLGTLKQFSDETDISQVRTRVIVEGKQTTCPLSIPADVVLPGATTLPVEDSTFFSDTGGTARIGTQVVTYTSRAYPVVYGVNPEGTYVTADAAAGATSVSVSDLGWIVTTGTSWAQIGDQAIYFGAFGGGALSSIPASGFGSLQHGVGAGDSVRALGMLVGVDGLTLAQDAGVEVVVRVEEDDAAAQATISALEGGDGVHEHIVKDGRLSIDGCTERAEAELTAFSAELLRASWETYDLNAVPGTIQTLNLASPDVVTGDLTVDSVQLDFPLTNYHPRRRCEGSTVKLETIMDRIKDS